MSDPLHDWTACQKADGRTATCFVEERPTTAVSPRLLIPAGTRRCYQLTRGCAVSESFTFQAETRQLLDIVANALYTDRHIFVRELVSNASDALEKLRHRQAAGDTIMEPEKELSITLTTDEAAGTLRIVDSGIGMSKQELMENIGTIAHSGSKAFVKKARESGMSGPDLETNLIGQFGVGFYSAFMVADEIVVYSKSADPEEPGHVWRSSGDGSFTIQPAEGLERGTVIDLKLKTTAREFSRPSTVEDIIKRYSNFVGYPIRLNSDQINTVSAIWAEPKHLVSEDDYLEFYRFKTGKEYSSPLLRLHFAADAPLELKALFYVPDVNEEGFGLGRARPGVDLYSRKVLIEAESKVMPEWLRFLRGVVDSEDIPLNISRESMQDTALMLRIKSVLTRRVLRFFEAEMRRDRATYEKFFSEFGAFLKEGVCSDVTYQSDIGRLLLFESSALPAGQLTTLDEYISRTMPGQDRIYYIVTPHRGLAEGSPYMEAFRGAGPGGRDIEVLYAYMSIDDFVFQQLGNFNGRKVVTAEASELGLSKDAAKRDSPAAGKSGTGKAGSAGEVGGGDATDAKDNGEPSESLEEHQVKELGQWLSQVALVGKVKEVRMSRRLRTTPAVVVDHESASVRRMMRMLDTQKRDSESPSAAEQVLPRQTLEINPDHPVITSLYRQRESQPSVAKAVAEQVFDNALIAAGLLDDARSMLPRLNVLLSTVMTSLGSKTTASTEDGAVAELDIGEDHAGAKKRFTPAKEAAFRESRDALEESLQEELLKGALLDEEVAEFAKQAQRDEAVEPEVLRVGPDGRLVEDLGERRS